MVNRRLKQIVALLIIIGFAGSIFFFLPKTPNDSPITYYILVPQSFVNSNSSFYADTLNIGTGQTYSVIGEALAVPSSTLTSVDNISNALQLAESLLSSGNFSYTVSNGAINCISSPNLLKTLCSNASLSESWALLEAGQSGVLSTQNVPLNSISLGSIYGNATFILGYFTGNSSSTSQNKSVPTFH